MDPKARKVHLEMFESNELMTELLRRKNLSIMIGVIFLDGTNGADANTVFCCGRWDADDGLAISEVLLDYAEETAKEEEEAGDEEPPHWSKGS